MVYVIVFAFILLDFVTGLIKAFATKEFCSSIMRQGLFHKAGEILILIFGCLVDAGQLYMELGFTVPVGPAMCVWITLMEIGSIVENLYRINPRIVPEKLQVFFKKINDHKEMTNNDNSQGKDR